MGQYYVFVESLKVIQDKNNKYSNFLIFMLKDILFVTTKGYDNNCSWQYAITNYPIWYCMKNKKTFFVIFSIVFSKIAILNGI